MAHNMEGAELMRFTRPHNTVVEIYDIAFYLRGRNCARTLILRCVFVEYTDFAV